MGAGTGISWATDTFNYLIGCEHADADPDGDPNTPPGPDDIAPECANCYAEAWDNRNLHGEGNHWGPGVEPRYMSDAYWRKPLAWNRDAQLTGVRRRVFCSSLADVFQRNRNPTFNARMNIERARLFALIRETPWLDWLLLTKRVGNLPAMLPWGPPDGLWSGTWGEPWPNVWLGATAGARRSLWRIPLLRQAPAARRFVSCEPILDGITGKEWDNVLGKPPWCFDGPPVGPIDWLIVGDESPSIRPAQVEWVATARDAAERHGVIFHFKQWAGAGHERIAGSLGAIRKGRKIHLPILDGKTWRGIPE